MSRSTHIAYAVIKKKNYSQLKRHFDVFKILVGLHAEIMWNSFKRLTWIMRWVSSKHATRFDKNVLAELIECDSSRVKKIKAVI